MPYGRVHEECFISRIVITDVAVDGLEEDFEILADQRIFFGIEFCLKLVSRLDVIGPQFLMAIGTENGDLIVEALDAVFGGAFGGRISIRDRSGFVYFDCCARPRRAVFGRTRRLRKARERRERNA